MLDQQGLPQEAKGGESDQELDRGDSTGERCEQGVPPPQGSHQADNQKTAPRSSRVAPRYYSSLYKPNYTLYSHIISGFKAAGQGKKSVAQYGKCLTMKLFSDENGLCPPV